jgi:hypothetical protein
MQERKILTLEKVLNLDRRPTLQEMVDLSIEDYTKYLYHKGIIKYIPEDYDLWEFAREQDCNDTRDLWIDYITEFDIIHTLRSSWYSGPDDEFGYWDVSEGFTLNESEEWNNPNIIEKGIVYVNGKEVEYDITNDNKLTVYEKYGDGRYSDPQIMPCYYLLSKKI